MHLSEAHLQEFIHEAMPGDERLQMQRHLAECASCRDRVGEARQDDRFVFGTLERLDQQPHPISIEQTRKLAQRGTGWLRYAAGLVLLAGLAGVTYALPGSPLRAWVASLRDDGGATNLNQPAQVNPARDTLMTGVAVTPGAAYRIEFMARQAAGVARIRLVDTAQVTVRAADERVGFNLGSERLTVANAGSRADFEILLPASLATVSIRVAGRTVWSRSGSVIRAEASADSAGRYLIPLR